VKIALGHIGRDRKERGERLVLAAERAVELAQKLGAEAGHERRARQIENIGDAFQAEARQRGDHLGRHSQCCERQRHQRVTLLARSDGRLVVETHGSPCRADGRSDGGAGRKAEVRHARDEIIAKFLLAAEEMRAAADVEQDAVGRIGGDERRVALTPVGNGLEQARIGRLILRHGGEGGMHGAGLRQRETCAQAEPFGRRVDREEEVEIAALAEDDERRRASFRRVHQRVHARLPTRYCARTYRVAALAARFARQRGTGNRTRAYPSSITMNGRSRIYPTSAGLMRLPRDAVGRKPLQPQAQDALRA
jgi:hypothetical protein